MSVSFYDVTVGTYVRIVESMTNVLAKGADHCKAEGLDLAEIVASRLYPDMANFHFQVVCVTHHSLEAVHAYQSGGFRPPNYDDCDYDALQAMTAATLEKLRGFPRDEIEALADGKVMFKIAGNEIPFTAMNFALSFSLPNFYFHATTAYDILRSKGVPLGKRDFLGAMAVGA